MPDVNGGVCGERRKLIEQVLFICSVLSATLNGKEYRPSEGIAASLI